MRKSLWWCMKNWTYRELLKKDVLRGLEGWLPQVGWRCLHKDSHGCLQHGTCIFGLVPITEKSWSIQVFFGQTCTSCKTCSTAPAAPLTCGDWGAPSAPATVPEPRIQNRTKKDTLGIPLDSPWSHCARRQHPLSASVLSTRCCSIEVSVVLDSGSKMTSLSGQIDWWLWKKIIISFFKISWKS